MRSKLLPPSSGSAGTDQLRKIVLLQFGAKRSCSCSDTPGSNLDPSWAGDVLL